MTVAFRAAAAAKASNTTVSVAIPAGYAAGDVEILIFDNGTLASNYPSVPTVDAAEWTQICNYEGMWVWARRRTASSGSTVGAHLTSGSTDATTLAFVSYTGATGWKSAYATTVNSDADQVAPSVAAPAGGLPLRVFQAIAGNGNPKPFIPPSGLTQRVAELGGGTVQENIYAYDAPAQTAAGATGTVTASYQYPGLSATLSLTLVVYGDTPPNTAAWSSPADAAILDRSVDQVLTYTATDPDSGDSQSKRKWRYSSDGGTTWTETTETTVSQSITITGGTLAAGDYQFQVEIADQSGTWATSWSPSLHLTFADAPSAPTIISPTSGGTVAATNPLAWSFPDQAEYDVRKVADNAGTADPSTIYYGPGPVTNTVTRDLTITNSVNGRWEHQQVRCMDSSGLWSPWADSRVDVTFDPPPTPTVTLTPVVDPFANPPKAAIVVTVATAAPGTGEVAATSVTVEARPVGATTDEWSRSGQPISGDVDFETPASGVEYEFRVTAYADNGATADTGWLTASSS